MYDFWYCACLWGAVSISTLVFMLACIGNLKLQEWTEWSVLVLMALMWPIGLFWVGLFVFFKFVKPRFKGMKSWL